MVHTRCHVPADQPFTLPERPLVRTRSACPAVPVDVAGHPSRCVVATHPNGPNNQRMEIERDGLMDEVFVTPRPLEAWTASDVVARSLHRGSLETARADDDAEHDRDRWCSPAACGHEAWQIIWPWLWNVRLEWGHRREPEPLRPTVCASALAPVNAPAAPPPQSWPCRSPGSLLWA